MNKFILMNLVLHWHCTFLLNRLEREVHQLSTIPNQSQQSQTLLSSHQVG